MAAGSFIDDLSLAVAPGESVALLGRNGVGKTTLLRTIMGLNQPKRGTITFAGMRIDKREPFEIARAGLGYVPQGREIFQELTVEENLLLGNLKAATADEIYAIFPALAAKRRTAGRASVGWPAAATGHRPRLDGQAETAVARRTLRGNSAVRRQRDFSHDPRRIITGERHGDGAGRAEHRDGAGPREIASTSSTVAASSRVDKRRRRCAPIRLVIEEHMAL